MAEAFAILGALSSIFQIVDFSGKVVSLTRTLIKSSDDAVRENIETERLARQYEALAVSIENAQKDPTESLVMQKSQKQVIEAAKQCRQEAKRLLNLLEALRMSVTATGLSRVREGSRKALRSLRKKDEIQRHLRNLQSYSNLLTVALLEAKSKKCDEIHGRILHELSFTGMQFRGNIIIEAHPQTCRWALYDDSFKLKSWLTSQNGIFWIMGKPGSGKSTLMKFLNQHQDTEDYLRTWAAGHGLVTASFYFWYLGSTSLQKSIQGLLRSILYRLFSEVPELSRIVCPEFFNSSAGARSESTWSESDLLSRLRRVVSHGRTSTGKKFCFFIDGLDEYVGNHLDLVDILTDLSTMGNIKLCLASRPWPVFQRAFEHRWPHLRLEDISRPDIHTYVDSSLRAMFERGRKLFSPADPSVVIRPQDETALIEEIVAKADGVFLWVYLVTRSVEIGFEDGDDIPTLRLRVHAFPPDLDDFFRDLLFRRVDPVHLKRVCQVLRLAFIRATAVQLGAGDTKSNVFLDYWLILQKPDGLDDEDFPYRMALQDYSPSDIHDMASITSRHLSAYTKELLVMERHVLKYTASSQVSFIHRTVCDFLRTEDMERVLVQHCPQYFQTEQCTYLLNLAKLKILSPRADDHAIMITRACNFIMTGRRYLEVDGRCMAEFEKVILAKSRGLSSKFLVSSASPFRATRKMWLLSACLDLFRGSDLEKLENWLANTIGKTVDCRNTLDVALGELNEIIPEDYSQTASDGSQEAGCDTMIGQRLFRHMYRVFKVARAQTPRPILRETQSAALLTAWGILEEFLETFSGGMRFHPRVLFSQPNFCIAKHTDGSAGHEWLGIVDFLQAELPNSRLAECKRTRHLARTVLS